MDSENIRLALEVTGLSEFQHIYAIVQESVGSETYTEVGRSAQNLSETTCNFPDQFTIKFHFEELQILRILLFKSDSNNNTSGLFIGWVESTLATLLRSENGRLDPELQNSVPADVSPQIKGTTFCGRGTVILKGQHFVRLDLTLQPSSSSTSANVPEPEELLRLVSETSGQGEEFWSFHFHAVRELARKDGPWRLSDPYIVVSRYHQENGGTWERVWQSEIINQNLLPNWLPGEIPIRKLIGKPHFLSNASALRKQVVADSQDDADTPIKIELYDWDLIGSHDYMGSFQTSLGQLLDHVPQTFSVIEEDKVPSTSSSSSTSGKIMRRLTNFMTGSGNYIDSGAVELTSSQIIYKSNVMTEDELKAAVVSAPQLSKKIQALYEMKFSKSFSEFDNNSHYFIEYLAHGKLEMGLICAIDFTASNRDQRRADSKHYIGGRTNQYQVALSQVGQVLIEYDNDKVVPMFGFGFKFRSSGDDEDDEDIHELYRMDDAYGLSGMLRQYASFLDTIELAYPTKLQPVIEQAANIAEQQVRRNELTGLYEFVGDKPGYTVLLVLCDGQYDDDKASLTDVLRRRASQLPLSIVIVGVGNENFSQMHELKESMTGSRNCIQFVGFEELYRQISSGGSKNRTLVTASSPSVSSPYDSPDFRQAIARAVLCRIPSQVCSFMEQNKILPPE